MPPIKKTWADSTNELTSVTPDGTEIARLRKSDGTVVKSTTQAIGNLGTAALIADLASTANGKGASTIGIEDAGGLIAATNVEGALAENRTAIDAIEADYLQAADIANMLETSDIGVSVQGYSSVLANTTASFTTAQETKLGHISVTQAVDLDALETAVAALDQATVLKGSWDASAGTFPGAGAAQAGWTYIVSTGGTVDSVAFAQNDRILAIVDNASTSTYAANWFKLDYTDQVLSVASKTGAVTLAANDISDATTAGRTLLTAADAAAQRTALNVEDGATADQTASEIETAYNSQVGQVSAGEKTAGTETAVRRFSPKDVADMAGVHGGGGSSVVRGYINGLTLSNNATDATNDIDIAAGVACSDDFLQMITLSSAITKRLDAAWAVGTGNGGLDTGTIANTTYFVWLIRRSDTGVVDALFSTSASSPTMPTNYDQKRLIGAIMRVSGAIRAFSQYGDEFLYLATVGDLNTVPGVTTAALATLSVPIGIKIYAIISMAGISGAAEDGRFYVSSPDVNDEAAGITNFTTGISSATADAQGWQDIRIRTNTSGQIRYRASSTTGQIIIGTRGFIMPRALF